MAYWPRKRHRLPKEVDADGVEINKREKRRRIKERTKKLGAWLVERLETRRFMTEKDIKNTYPDGFDKGRYGNRTLSDLFSNYGLIRFENRLFYLKDAAYERAIPDKLMRVLALLASTLPLKGTKLEDAHQKLRYIAGRKNVEISNDSVVSLGFADFENLLYFGKLFFLKEGMVYSADRLAQAKKETDGFVCVGSHEGVCEMPPPAFCPYAHIEYRKIRRPQRPKTLVCSLCRDAQFYRITCVCKTSLEGAPTAESSIPVADLVGTKRAREDEDDGPPAKKVALSDDALATSQSHVLDVGSTPLREALRGPLVRNLAADVMLPDDQQACLQHIVGGGDLLWRQDGVGDVQAALVALGCLQVSTPGEVCLVVNEMTEGCAFRDVLEGVMALMPEMLVEPVNTASPFKCPDVIMASAATLSEKWSKLSPDVLRKVKRVIFCISEEMPIDTVGSIRDNVMQLADRPQLLEIGPHCEPPLCIEAATTNCLNLSSTVRGADQGVVKLSFYARCVRCWKALPKDKFSLTQQRKLGPRICFVCLTAPETPHRELNLLRPKKKKGKGKNLLHNWHKFGPHAREASTRGKGTARTPDGRLVPGMQHPPPWIPPPDVHEQRRVNAPWNLPPEVHEQHRVNAPWNAPPEVREQRRGNASQRGDARYGYDDPHPFEDHRRARGRDHPYDGPPPREAARVHGRGGEGPLGRGGGGGPAMRGGGGGALVANDEPGTFASRWKRQAGLPARDAPAEPPKVLQAPGRTTWRAKVVR